ncbi:MAG: AAA family ATPase [Candidatus Limnocylindria bacterium]
MTRIALPDPAVVLLVGPAGSGKSTLAGRLFAPDEVLSSDALREAIAGDAADQRATGPAFRALGRALERRLAAGLLTVVDATNLLAADRRPWLAAARRHGVPVAAIVFDLPRDVIRSQNAGRARVVAEAVIDRHVGRLDGALARGELAAEGIAPIVVLRSAEDARTLSIERIRG